MSTIANAGLAALVFLAAVGSATAETVTVTISSDVVDIDWSSGTISDLPGPDGEVSFSEALIATNNTPGHQTIAFAIPQSDWQLQWLYPGQAVLRSVTGYFWRANDAVTIDGTTQTAFTGDTNPDGWEVMIDGLTLYLNADNCTLLGFNHTAVMVSGSNSVIQGNTGSMYITAIGGSGSLIEGNEATTIKIDRSSDNTVTGNTTSRVRVLGWFDGGEPAVNNRIGGPNPEDRNYITGWGTYDSEGRPNGTTLQLFDTADTIIENNWIGTAPDGMASGSDASTAGVGFEGVNQGTIIRNNRIAGILGIGTWPHHFGEFFGQAILVTGAASDIAVVGNKIGLNALDEPVLGSVTGILLTRFNYAGISSFRIGGAGTGEGNIIAGHRSNAITVGHVVPEVRISGNSIYGNGALGIDLLAGFDEDGVTPNDPLDNDTGGNGLQNFPDIETATLEGAVLHVIGSLHSSPAGSFTIELFASPDCDGTGFGEGQVFLGSTSVVTDVEGNADFDVTLPASVVPEGWIVTSTATLEPVGATSEFSACTVIVEGIAAAITDDQHGPSGAALPRLAQSAPNPFRSQTTISYELPRAGDVQLAIYDAAGRLVRTLRDDDQPAGVHDAVWDGRNASGSEVANGVYFYELRVDGWSSTRRVLLTR